MNERCLERPTCVVCSSTAQLRPVGHDANGTVYLCRACCVECEVALDGGHRIPALSGGAK